MTGQATTRDGAAGRDISLDVGRYLLLVGVIALHLTETIPPADIGWWTVVVQNLSTVAVPVFFVTAGYFLSWRSRSYVRCIVQPVKRLVPLYLFWVAIYIIHYWLTAGFGWVWNGHDLLNGGPGYHLWFLPALLVALILVALASKLTGLWGALLICAIMAGIGFTRGALHDVLGMPGGAQRAGIMMAPVFVWLGAAIRARAPARIDGRGIGVVLVLALLVQGIENARLSQLTLGHVLMVRTFPLTMPVTATAAFLAIRAIPASIWPRWLVEQSRCTLGVYAVHVLVIYSIGQMIVPTGPASLALLVAIVFVLSSLIARLMLHARPLRRFVT